MNVNIDNPIAITEANQVANDEDVRELSKRFIAKNRKTYEELAK